MVGKVAAVGKEVTKFKVGDFAGVGCFTSSCRNCEYCAEGNEQHCEKGMRGTYNTPAPEDEVPGGVTMGGYSSASELACSSPFTRIELVLFVCCVLCD